MPLMKTFRVPTMANWLRYRGPGYYVLFALWVTGIIDAILNLTAPSQRHALFFGRAGVLFIPVGVLTVFSFILWLRLKLARGFVGYHVLFALWVTGIIDVIFNIIASRQHHLLFFGGAEVLFIPIGVLTVFSFILWLIWNKIEKPSLINRASEPPGRVADAGGVF